MKPLSRTTLPLLGGAFGARENSIVQAAAMGAGSMSGLFVGAIPAMYVLGTQSKSPRDDFGLIICVTFVCGSFGVFFATALRRFFLVQVARELRLLFPTPTAVALTIKSMHAGRTAHEAIGKLKALGASFAAAFIQRIASYYAIGILYDSHIFTWIHVLSGYGAPWALGVESWGWYLEWSPAFIGSGMLIGLNAALSMFGGAVLAWGIIGPLLILSGECVGVPRSTDPNWGGYYSYTSLKDLGHAAMSPRYWLLWPGVMIMTCSSMAELAVQYKAVWAGLKSMKHETRSLFNALLANKGAGDFQSPVGSRMDQDGDQAQNRLPNEDQFPSWIWISGLLVSISLALVMFKSWLGVNPGLTILACAMAFVFSFLVIQVGAITDQAPIATVSKASQLIFGGVKGLPTRDALRTNLLAGSLVSGSAEVAVSLISDFRTGFLLGTPPVKQWTAHALGTLAAVFFAPGMFILFVGAYPCILKEEADCPFGAPSVSAWAAVARAVNDSSVSIPRSSKIFAVAMGMVTIAQVLFRQYFLVGRREWARGYLPNWGAVALAFVLPAPAFTTASMLGALGAWLWRGKKGSSFKDYGYAVAAGLIAGEGLGGVAGAVLQIAGLLGEGIGTSIGCPAGTCL